MSNQTSRNISCIGLVAGSLLGLAGTFAPTAAIRGLLWGLDGVALITATALLAIHYSRQGEEILAAGFLVFVAGETLVLSTAAMDIAAAAPVFAAGVSPWAASLVLLCIPKVATPWVRIVGAIASLLFAAVALQVFAGCSLTSLTHCPSSRIHSGLPRCWDGRGSDIEVWCNAERTTMPNAAPA